LSVQSPFFFSFHLIPRRETLWLCPILFLLLLYSRLIHYSWSSPMCEQQFLDRRFVWNTATCTPQSIYRQSTNNCKNESTSVLTINGVGYFDFETCWSDRWW
jgi:hypothetical protein